MKFVEIVWLLRIDTIAWLHHIDILTQKAIFDIQLTNGPTMSDSQAKKHTNGSGFDNEVKSFIIIKPVLLMKTLGHQGRPFNGTISKVLILKTYLQPTKLW